MALEKSTNPAETRAEIDKLNKDLEQYSKKQMESAMVAEDKILEYKRQKLKEYLDAKTAGEEAAAKRIAELNLMTSQQDLDDAKKKAAEKRELEKKKALEKAGGENASTADKARIEAEFKQREKKEEDLLDKKFKKQQKQAQKIFKQEEKNQDVLIYKKAQKEASQNLQSAFNLTNGESLSERWNQLKDATTTGGKLDLNKTLSALADYATSLKNEINDIASNMSAVDTRLQGSKNASKNYWGGKSYWMQMSSDVTAIAGVSPYVAQKDVVSNIKSMVGQGIAFNVEQRAFLQTLSDKIATTFNATDASLVKLVRIQQQDTTAARLGMESALTSFLNNMYETTEYMTDMASQIRSNIYEASALMSATSATEFEYQVQKWMGSLYSVGFSNTSSLSSTLGKLAAGDVSAISGGGTGNLLVMAANQAGLSVADLLANGMDGSETNKLMAAVVNYLGDIYEDTHGNNLLAQQMAGVYGLTASDLKAAANLASSMGSISGNSLSYNGMLGQLNTMANTMYQRTSMGEMMSNSLANLQYSMANSIASNPALYSVYMLASMLKDTTGGLDFSLPTVMGNGMAAQTFNVADILLGGTMAGGILTGIGSMIAAGSGGGISGSGMLNALGIGKGITSVQRGNGTGLITSSGAATSSSGYVGGGGEDVQSKSMTETTDDANSQTVSAQEESTEATTTDINENVVQIYQLLAGVVDGTSSFKVDMGDSSSWTTAMRGGLL